MGLTGEPQQPPFPQMYPPCFLQCSAPAAHGYTPHTRASHGITTGKKNAIVTKTDHQKHTRIKTTSPNLQGQKNQIDDLKDTTTTNSPAGSPFHVQVTKPQQLHTDAHPDRPTVVVLVAHGRCMPRSRSEFSAHSYSDDKPSPNDQETQPVHCQNAHYTPPPYRPSPPTPRPQQ